MTESELWPSQNRANAPIREKRLALDANMPSTPSMKLNKLINQTIPREPMRWRTQDRFSTHGPISISGMPPNQYNAQNETKNWMIKRITGSTSLKSAINPTMTSVITPPRSATANSDGTMLINRSNKSPDKKVAPIIIPPPLGIAILWRLRSLGIANIFLFIANDI